jgi:hypothetical protein
MAEITRRARTARIKPEASDGRPSLRRTCNVQAAKAAGAVPVHAGVHAAIVEACRERAISRSSAMTASCLRRRVQTGQADKATAQVRSDLHRRRCHSPLARPGRPGLRERQQREKGPENLGSPCKS